jgi:hypothetical protein
MFEIEWLSGDCTWEPFGVIKHLEALQQYLEAQGTTRVKDLPWVDDESSEASDGTETIRVAASHVLKPSIESTHSHPCNEINLTPYDYLDYYLTLTPQHLQCQTTMTNRLGIVATTPKGTEAEEQANGTVHTIATTRGSVGTRSMSYLKSLVLTLQDTTHRPRTCDSFLTDRRLIKELEQLLTIADTIADILESPDGSSSWVTFLSVSRGAGGPITEDSHTGTKWQDAIEAARGSDPQVPREPMDPGEIEVIVNAFGIPPPSDTETVSEEGNGPVPDPVHTHTPVNLPNPIQIPVQDPEPVLELDPKIAHKLAAIRAMAEAIQIAKETAKKISEARRSVDTVLGLGETLKERLQEAKLLLAMTSLSIAARIAPTQPSQAGANESDNLPSPTQSIVLMNTEEAHEKVMRRIRTLTGDDGTKWTTHIDSETEEERTRRIELQSHLRFYETYLTQVSWELTPSRFGLETLEEQRWTLLQRTKEDAEELDAILKRLASTCEPKEAANQVMVSSSSGSTLSPNKTSTSGPTKKKPVSATDNRENRTTSCAASPQGTSSSSQFETKSKGKGRIEEKEEGEDNEG